MPHSSGQDDAQWRRILRSQPVTPADCIFCKIVSGRARSDVVYQDAKHIAFLDIAPFSSGHTLVCPKKHGETILDMTEAEIAGLFRTASRVAKAAVAAVGADGFRLVQNNGEAANQVVAHVHVHVIPVKMVDKGRYVDRKAFSPEEMKMTAAKIREKIGGAE